MALLIAGGTGFIGRSLKQFYVSKGVKVYVVSRNPIGQDDILWTDIKKFGFPANIRAVINLSGRNIGEMSPSLFLNKHYQRFKKELFDSRIGTTKLLVDVIKTSLHRPEIFINSSAIGFYKPSLTDVYTENYSYVEHDFITRLCKEWEEAAKIPEFPEIKQIQLRTGLVLGSGGGMLQSMYPTFICGLGGPIGNGKQWMSWIHMDDMIGLIDFILNNRCIASGPVNATAPNPVTSREFTSTFGRTLSRPAILPVPTLFIKAIFGERATLVLDGQKVIPQKALDAGYQFKYPKIDEALRAVYP